MANERKDDAWNGQHPTTSSTFSRPVSQRERTDGVGYCKQGSPQLYSIFDQQSSYLTATVVPQFPQLNLDGDPSFSPDDTPRGPQLPQLPRSGGFPGHGSFDNHAAVSVPAQSPTSTGEFVQAPERNRDKYSSTAKNNQEKCSDFTTDFFADSAMRALERNQRERKLDAELRKPNQGQGIEEQMWCSAGQKEAKYLRFLRLKDGPENYQTIKVIGKGAFGEVKLVRKQANGQVFAMKSLLKSEMIQKQQVSNVRSERDVLAQAESPWVVKLFATFQDAHFLYMVMEYLPGGDLMMMLIKYDIFSEDITRFYMAECILAIEAVHELGYIHRDVKPDNILLDSSGHVKLTDFGLSTGFDPQYYCSYYERLLQGNSSNPRDGGSIAIDQVHVTVSNPSQVNEWRRSRRLLAYTAVGTPDYIAPEIINGQGYSFSCDWWSLGTIMFECLVGWPPFCSPDRNDTYKKVVNWKESLYFPDEIKLGPQAENMVRSLICNPRDRLGGGGAAELKAHPFFQGVQFDRMRQFKAPFEPHLTSDADTTYFPVDEISQTDNASRLKAELDQQARDGVEPQPEELAKTSLPFIGYTFNRFDSNWK